MPQPSQDINLTPMPFWKPTKGLILNDDATNLPIEASPDCENILVRNGVLSRRGGLVDAGFSIMSGSVKSIMTHMESDGKQHTLVESNGKIYELNYEDDTLTDLMETGETLSTGSPAISYCDFLGRFFFANMVDGLMTWTPGAKVSEVTGFVSIPYSIDTFKNHIFVFGSTANPRSVYWSDYGEYNDWTLGSSGQKELADDGESITCGVATSGIIYVFKPSAIYIGEYVNYPVWFGFKRQITNEGCIAPKGVTKIGDAVYFIGNRGIYKIDPTEGLVNIGRPIWDDIKDAMPERVKTRSVAIWNKVNDSLMCFFSTNSTGYLDVVYEFDLATGTWVKHTYSATLKLITVNSILETRGLRWVDIAGDYHLWHSVDVTGTGHITAVSPTSCGESYVYAVGTGNDPGIWKIDFVTDVVTEIVSPTTEDLYGVYAVDTDKYWIVGDNDACWYFDGADWTEHDPNTGGNLRAVFAYEDSFVAVAGPSGVSIWDGATWTPHAVGSFNAIHGLDPYPLFVVGNSGVVKSFNGTIWTTHVSGYPTINLNGVYVFDTDDVFAIGEDGLALHFDTVWHRIYSPVTTDLNCITGNSNYTEPAGDRFYVGGDENEFLSHNGTALYEMPVEDDVGIDSFTILGMFYCNHPGVPDVPMGRYNVAVGHLTVGGEPQVWLNYWSHTRDEADGATTLWRWENADISWADMVSKKLEPTLMFGTATAPRLLVYDTDTYSDNNMAYMSYWKSKKNVISVLPAEIQMVDVYGNGALEFWMGAGENTETMVYNVNDAADLDIDITDERGVLYTNTDGRVFQFEIKSDETDSTFNVKGVVLWSKERGTM